MKSTHPEIEVFGSDEQASMMRRGLALRQLTKHDPRFSYYGRNVALTAHATDAVDIVASLAELQGASACFYVPVDHADAFRSELTQRGYNTDRFELWRGDQAALAAAEAVLAERQLPGDLGVVSIDTDTPAKIVTALDGVTDSCGVLLPSGLVIRGLDAPSVVMLALDEDGHAVASAASVAANHIGSKHGKDAWWGLLATREDRRGEGIALTLGAMALLAMHQRHGYSSFYTGVREGNTASEALCRKIGLSRGNYCAVSALDPRQFASARITK